MGRKDMQKYFCPTTKEIILTDHEKGVSHTLHLGKGKLIATINPVGTEILNDEGYEKVITNFTEQIIAIIKSIKSIDIMMTRIDRNISKEEMKILSSLATQGDIYATLLNILNYLEILCIETREGKRITIKDNYNDEFTLNKGFEELREKGLDSILEEYRKLLFRTKRKARYLSRLIDQNKGEKPEVEYNPRLTYMTELGNYFKKLEEIHEFFNQVCFIYHTKKATISDKEVARIDRQKSMQA